MAPGLARAPGTCRGTLRFNRSDVNLIVGGPISGTGAVAQDGSGLTWLPTSNSYTGATTVNAGTLQATHANSLGATSAGTTVVAGATQRTGVRLAKRFVKRSFNVCLKWPQCPPPRADHGFPQLRA